MNGWSPLFFFIAVMSWGYPVLLSEHPAPRSIALVLSPGDAELVLVQLLMFRPPGKHNRSPIIIAMEPGPIDLQGGLRVLPNQVVPRLEAPDLLIVSSLGNLAVPDTFLAFIRKCLLENRPVWVVGPLPKPIADLPLWPGQIIRGIDPENLLHALQDTYPRKYDNGQSLVQAMVLTGAR